MTSDTLEIVHFESRYRDDFKRLNVEWLEEYFYVEAIDDEVLSDPEGRILQAGGAILLARLNHEIVGTAALIKADDDRVELSKMAVTRHHRGAGIGRALLRAAIDHFKQTGASTLFLESNSVLTPALALYASHGFRHAARPEGPSHYHRSDVYMVYRPEDDDR